jgi:ABC-type uncharacterized transport system involved in gliding motility auxiliary subunit
MTTTPSKRGALWGLWRTRFRRAAFGLNVGAALAVAAVLVVLVNVAAARYSGRWNLSRSDYYTLSDKTRSLLDGIHGEVKVLAFYEQNHELYRDVRNLLEEYEESARRSPSLRLTVEVADPNRDLARVRGLKQSLGLSEPNVVVFEYEGRRKYVREADITDYEHAVDYDKLLSGKPSVRRTRAAFRGEQAFSSALLNVTRTSVPVVYFTTGHGERQPDDANPLTGYTRIAERLQQENLELRVLLPAASTGVPAECALLVVAGPIRALSTTEVDMVRAFLERNGRLLLLTDPATTTGLEDLLERWGIRLGAGAVTGPTMTGSDLLVMEYGRHAITKPLRDVLCLFYGARPVEPLDTATSATNTADRPHAFPLAFEPKTSWVESNPKQSPPRFDEGEDRPGPVSLAVAVERGSGDLSLGIKATRLVVFGDSDFVANGALRGAIGGNADLFLGAVNWLLDRHELLAIGPKSSATLRIEMSRGQVFRLWAIVVFLAPAVISLVGLAVWFRRRY